MVSCRNLCWAYQSTKQIHNPLVLQVGVDLCPLSKAVSPQTTLKAYLEGELNYQHNLNCVFDLLIYKQIHNPPRPVLQVGVDVCQVYQPPPLLWRALVVPWRNRSLDTWMHRQRVHGRRNITMVV